MLVGLLPSLLFYIAYTLSEGKHSFHSRAEYGGPTYRFFLYAMSAAPTLALISARKSVDQNVTPILTHS